MNGFGIHTININGQTEPIPHHVMSTPHVSCCESSNESLYLSALHIESLDHQEIKINTSIEIQQGPITT